MERFFFLIVEDQRKIKKKKIGSTKLIGHNNKKSLETTGSQNDLKKTIFTSLTHSWACANTSETFSLAAAVKISSLKKHC